MVKFSLSLSISKHHPLPAASVTCCVAQNEMRVLCCFVSKQSCILNALAHSLATFISPSFLYKKRYCYHSNPQFPDITVDDEAKMPDFKALWLYSGDLMLNPMLVGQLETQLLNPYT